MQFNYHRLCLLGAMLGPLAIGSAMPAKAVLPVLCSSGDYMTEVQGFFVYPGGNGTAILDSARKTLSGTVIIPDTISYTMVINNETTRATLKITYINKQAFDGCENIEQIQLPAGVSRIGDEAFANCPKLKAVILPDLSKGITFGQNVFENTPKVRLYGNYSSTPAWLDGYKSYYDGKLAAEGVWKQSSNGKWWFSYFDGTWPKDDWAKIGGIWYHFDPNGYRETGWIKVKKDWYYLNMDGTLALSTWIGSNYVDHSGRFIPNRWVKAEGKWRYRFGDGTFPENTWATIDGKRYLFDNEGYMVKGWIEVNGCWYHLASDGALDINKKVGQYYVNEAGVWVQDAWEKTDGIWRYRYADGTIAKDGMVDIKGKTYYFDAAGRMKTGWIQLPEGYRYFRRSGEMAVNGTIDGYIIDANGIWVSA